MQLIGAGLPRTGTLSQKIALEMLGVGPCYHMVNVLADLDQANLWKQALSGDGPWDELFEGFQSTVDWPGGFFYKELIEKYPDSKVLLSVRDAEKWEASMRLTVRAVRHGDSLMCLMSNARAKVDTGWAGFLEMIDALLWEGQGTFAGGHDEAAQMIEAMHRHNEEVQRLVPDDRLLVWSVDQGWEPLCEFLGKPVPDMPFPHVNDSVEFVDRVVDGAILTISEWRKAQMDSPDAVSA